LTTSSLGRLKKTNKENTRPAKRTNWANLILARCALNKSNSAPLEIGKVTRKNNVLSIILKDLRPGQKVI